ncbi:MAG: glycoside hydrolase family 2 [Tannerella sp.]|nr:glycoside hydrolase family 2 [Tannerella sp.]
MKNFLAIVLTAIVIVTACTGGDRFAAIEKGFLTPPDSIKTGVYWYWINDHISVEGVVKDIQAMKKAGINRAFIGSNIVSGNYFGKVKVFSDEWYDVLHAAMKEATRLNIELGLFNCPGWSQSGGPWIKPEQSMRYLTSSELRVKGPQKISQKLEQPTDFFQDVKVIAFPVKPDFGVNLLTSKGVRFYPHNIRTNTPEAKYVISEAEASLDISLPQEEIVRSIIIKPAGHLNVNIEVQVKEGAEYKDITKFAAVRTRFDVNTGFKPFSPVAIAVEDTQGKDIRLKFKNNGGENRIAEIILSTSSVVDRFAEKTLAKVCEGNLPSWDYYTWGEAQKAPEKGFPTTDVQDISQKMTADGILTWDVPEGEWIILRTGMAITGIKNAPASPEGTGLEVDKMNKDYMEPHFNGFLGKIMERIPAEDRQSLKIVVEDSYEMGSQNFTDGFLDDFKQRYGYDATPFLPVFDGYVIGSPDISERFLWDLRRLIADKVSYDYVGGLREVSHKHGLTTWLENYGHWGFPGEFLQYGGQSDEIGGEFWDGQSTNRYENRIAASCAHTYGKPRVSAESFTSGGPAYTRFPRNFKSLGDWSFTEGINQSVFHVYIQQPYENDYPGIDAWFGNEFNRKNTWFGMFDLFTLYVKRCNFMLQQGLNVADVAYFIGEEAPKMTGPNVSGEAQNPFGNAGVETKISDYLKLPKGYDYDYINAEVIIRDMTVKNGLLTLPHGTSYRILVLPPQTSMRPELLEKIERLVADGGVVLGPAPDRTPSLQNYPASELKVQEISKNMWGEKAEHRRQYGKGLIFNTATIEEVLKELNIKPDCIYDSDKALYTHRTVDGSEVYFISNQTDKDMDLQASFRVSGLQPELWDAVTGSRRPLPQYTENEGIITIPLHFDPSGSAFIVFRNNSSGNKNNDARNYPPYREITTVTTPWEVTFEADSLHRGPAKPVIFNTLTDWSQNESPEIKYYSGTAVYKTKFSVTSSQLPKTKNSIFLKFDMVTAMAKVTLNGKYVGGLWTAPYRLDVTDILKEGENSLTVEVASTWRNRIIGDMQLPEADRRIKAIYGNFKPDMPLQPSGLTGEVKIVTTSDL